MKEFIDTQHWPLVDLHMPERVADEQAHGMIAQLESLYARAQPFVLLIDGVELARHSVRFMTSYAQWSRDRFTDQQRYCLGAIRIEMDETLRRGYERKAQAWNASRRAPYPYRVVATRSQAEAQASAWLAGHGVITVTALKVKRNEPGSGSYPTQQPHSPPHQAPKGG